MRDTDAPEPDPLLEAPRKSGLVTTFAVLNLVFGFACGCVGVIYAVFGLVLPGVFEGVAAQAAAAQQARRASIATQIGLAETRRDAAPDAEDAGDERSAQEFQDEIDGLEAQLARLEQNSPVKAMAGVRDFLGGPAVIGSILGTAVIALIWNLGLVVSGFGLFGRASWARSLVVGAAAVKILMEVGFAVWVATTMPAAMNAMMAALPDAGAGGPSVAELAQMRQMMSMQAVVQGVVGSVVGSIYPAILLVVFLLRGVRQEFSDWAHWRAGAGGHRG